MKIKDRVLKVVLSKLVDPWESSHVTGQRASSTSVQFSHSISFPHASFVDGYRA